MPSGEKNDDCGHRKGCGCRKCVRDHAVAPDPLVDGIDPECCGGAGFIVLRGFMAQGGAEGLWRLYKDLGMDEYVLLRDEDIVAQRQLSDRSIVWICGDRLIRRVRTGAALQMQRDFLGGAIARDAQGDRGQPGGSPFDGDWDGPQSAKPSKCCP